MRVVLLYPPPWKINAVDDGPPPGFQQSSVDGDFLQTPYGLLSLAAQVSRAGHQVKVFNMCSHPWAAVVDALRRTQADLWGLSCLTANRRGVALTAQCIRDHHPRSHIVVGGPHASALPKEMLDRHPSVDSVVVGEGERTLLELIERLGGGQSLKGIAGLAYRSDGGAQIGPSRSPISDLDSLESLHRHFTTHVFMTSRGCPGRCTYCAKNAVWGTGYRANSVDYVLQALEAAVRRAPVKMLMFKDDTFTANRQRAMEICRRIREQKLDFLWSCDTRADVLSEPLLREMRLAGCQRLSLGVESGSPVVLKNIKKNLTPEKILRTTAMARSYGFQVRFYMMLGNRGETAETFRQSLELIRAARPHQCIFACLSVYPGTQDFLSLQRAGVLHSDVFFDESFLELKMPFDADDEVTSLLSDWFEKNRGLRDLNESGVQECRQALERLGDYHAAHMDLAGACYRAGQLDEAEQHVARALALGYPAPGLARNYLACIAHVRGDPKAAMEELDSAMRDDALHPVVIANTQRMRDWMSQGALKGRAPELIARHDFQIFERTAQPTLPGPLGPEFDRWD